MATFKTGMTTIHDVTRFILGRAVIKTDSMGREYAVRHIRFEQGDAAFELTLFGDKDNLMIVEEDI